MYCALHNVHTDAQNNKHFKYVGAETKRSPLQEQQVLQLLDRLSSAQMGRLKLI